MTRVYHVLLAAVICVMATGCGSNSPKDVAEKWLLAFHKMDAETTLKLSAPATRNLVNTLNSLSGKIADSTQAELDKIKVNIKGVKEEGNRCVVTYTTSDNPAERKLNLVLVNDKWMVLFTKSDLVTEMAGAGEEETDEVVPEEADTTAAPPANAAQQ